MFMTVRIPWDRYEVALLFKSYERIVDGVDSNTEAVKLSETLRELAIRRNVPIDEAYRNVNGIKMRLSNVQYLFIKGQKGLSGGSAMIRQMYEPYKANHVEFQMIMKEAIRLTDSNTSIENAFFAYAKKRTGLSPEMIVDYMQKAADYCHLKQPLLGMTEVKAVRNVQQKVAEDKLLRFRYGREAQTIRIVAQLYYTFIKSYRDIKEKLFVPEKSIAETSVSVQNIFPTKSTSAEGISEHPAEIITDGAEEDVSKSRNGNWNQGLVSERLFVDFTQERSYLFTKPISYTYGGMLHNAKSWNRLYVEVCNHLFTDYYKTFMSIINGDIPGHSALAFADEQNYRQMRVPKSFAPGYYLESNLDATTIVRKLCGLHRLFGLTDELQIEYRTIEGYQPPKFKSHHEMDGTRQLSTDMGYDWERTGLLLVDLLGDASYAFTRPEAYEYKGVTRRVNKWSKLYINLCGALFEDHRDAFMNIINGDVPGYHALAFADEQHKSDMRVARCFAPGFYLESNIDATMIVRRIRGLNQLFDLGDGLRISYIKLGDTKIVEVPKESDEEWLINELRTGKIPYVDNRSTDGCLWIVADMSISILLNKAEERGYRLHFKQDGCRAFPNRPVIWTKDQPMQPTKITPIIPTDNRKVSLNIFKQFLLQEKGFAERTANNYRNSIRVVEAYIQRNHLLFSLLDTDADGVQKIFDLLMGRPDFQQINIQSHSQFSAALGQYITFLHQSEKKAFEDGQKQLRHATIIETIFEVLRQAGKPMTVSEIYQAIIRDDLYPFGAQDPQAVVYSIVSLACRQIDARIKEGKDVLIRTEENSRKVYQVMSSEKAAVYLERQRRESKLEFASTWAEYESVLKLAFPKGFQKESVLDMKKLRKRWAEIHGEELKDSDEIVRMQLAAHCVDTSKRWYLAELLLSDKDRQTVLRYIDHVLSSGKTVLYYSSIYAALEYQLESTVLTENLLASYLWATCKDKYILRKHYLTNNPCAQVDLSEEIKAVMLACGRPIHTDELKQALHHLPPEQVERELHTHPEFIKDASHVYFHESMVDLTDQELNLIATFIREELDDQGYMIGGRIQQKLERLYPEIAERLSFLTLLGVRGVVAYKLRDRFAFSGPVITPKGKDMNMTDIFAMFCRHHVPFSLDELASFAKDCDSIIYMDVVHRNCIRVSETEFVAIEAVRWDVPHVDAAIARYCPGKYVSLKNIQYFDAFPYVGYSWNSYLLEQYVATESKDFMLMHSSYAKNSTSGAIVRRNAEFDTFDEVLADILAKASIELEKSPCLEYLANAGYITRKKLANINKIIMRAKMLRS